LEAIRRQLGALEVELDRRITEWVRKAMHGNFPHAAESALR
jgi:hypothetical protein